MQTSYFWEHQLHFANAKTIVFANDLSKNHIFYFHRTVNSNYFFLLALIDAKERDFLWDLFTSWATEATRYHAVEISEEEYNTWRYHFPKFDKGNIWTEVPPDLK